MTIALFGTGLLGCAIGHRLLQRGHGLIVWNRSAERSEHLQQAGARLAGSPSEAAIASDWLITVLSDGPSTAAVLLEQIGDGLAGRSVLQMGTIGVQESEALAAAVLQRGGRYLEAPVLGSRPEALAGTLQLMAGGPADLFAQALPLLRDLAAEPLHMGPVGSGMTTKLALNQLIASLTHAFSLSLHLVQHQGVAVETFMQLLLPACPHGWPYSCCRAWLKPRLAGWGQLPSNALCPGGGLSITCSDHSRRSPSIVSHQGSRSSSRLIDSSAIS